MSTKIKQPSADEVSQMKSISNKIRQAIREALPAPAEQFFTLMIPGKVINFEVRDQSEPCIVAECDTGLRWRN